MYTRKKQLPFLVAPLVILFVGLACSSSEPTPTSVPPTPPTPPEQQGKYAAETASYTIDLVISPAVTTPGSDQFPGAKEAEVTALMSCLSTTDQGQPVNHHLEVHIFSKSIGVYSASGTEVKDIVPVVAITDHATGNSRDLADLTACLSASQVDYPYFGDNVYLPDGTYSATVGVADETAVFESVAVKSDGP